MSINPSVAAEQQTTTTTTAPSVSSDVFKKLPKEPKDKGLISRIKASLKRSSSSSSLHSGKSLNKNDTILLKIKDSKQLANSSDVVASSATGSDKVIKGDTIGGSGLSKNANTATETVSLGRVLSLSSGGDKGSASRLRPKIDKPNVNFMEGPTSVTDVDNLKNNGNKKKPPETQLSGDLLNKGKNVAAGSPTAGNDQYLGAKTEMSEAINLNDFSDLTEIVNTAYLEKIASKKKAGSTNSLAASNNSRSEMSTETAYEDSSEFDEIYLSQYTREWMAKTEVSFF
jgi:hypothetical protein